MIKCMEKVVSTIVKISQLMKDNGLKINFMEKEYFIMKIHWSSIITLIFKISTMCRIIGLSMKVIINNNAGHFIEDSKFGEGTLLLSNG